MSLPVNNLALTLSEIPFKPFIKESSELATESINNKKFKLGFDGNEAKVAYDEIISLESERECAVHKKNSKSNNKQCIVVKPIESAKVDVKDVNSLFKALELGDYEFVTKHFNTSNVNIRDQYDWTPLMSAACSGQVEIVRFLLKLGANKRAKDKAGLKAIDLAAKNSHLAIINLLSSNSLKNNKKEVTKGNKVLKDDSCEDQGGFYCDICKIFFMESSKSLHETSTLHVFNTRPKLRSAFYGIPKQNRGYQLLLNKGWDEEGGLGPTGAGQKYPVKTVLKRDRKGLGQSDKNIARVTHFKPRDSDAVKSVNKIKRKPFKRKDRQKQIKKEAAKTRAYRRALS